ncbi:MAG: hypothetical protein KDD67_16320 [Ignavibacteriae bacterium]|nr:hypothetical protein [Ignavibacteriota bacterium]MCB9217297.1 hypothetical protein [Ignavibacteria bacterium]
MNRRQLQQYVLGVLVCSGLLLSLMLVSCGGDVVRPRVTMGELTKFASIPVTIEGKIRSAYMTDDSCYYTEWAYGIMGEDASISLTPAFQSNDSILVVTPYGVIQLDIFQIKLYLGSYFSRTFSSENSSIAPLPIQKLVEKEGGVIAVHEFLLLPEQTYFAQVRKNTLAGVNGSDSTSQYVLEISDRPFNGTTPQRKPTPSYDY